MVCVREAITHVQVGRKALAALLRDAVISTLREGEPEQKLEVIESLKELGAADAAPFVLALTDATKDDDPRVRQAATKALDRIKPNATGEDKGK